MALPKSLVNSLKLIPPNETPEPGGIVDKYSKSSSAAFAKGFKINVEMPMTSSSFIVFPSLMIGPLNYLYS